MSISAANSRSSRHNEAIKTSGLFPESMQDTAENLIYFIEKYYEYLNTAGLPSYQIENITSEKDIDFASKEYLTEIQSLIARNIPNSEVVDKVTLYKIIFKYYHTRGSEDSINSFFKIFFNETVRIFYPKDFLFDLSGGSGEWGEFNPLTLTQVSTNPNKKYIQVISSMDIAPPKPNNRNHNTKRPILTHVRNDIWSLDGEEDYGANVPHIIKVAWPNENSTTFRWRFQYKDTFAYSLSDTTWPDEASWTQLVREIVYVEPETEERNVEYRKAGDETKDIEYHNDFAIRAIPWPGLDLNELVLSLESSDELIIYKLIQLNPAIWTQTTVEGEYWNYTNNKSFLSHNYKLQDSYYWQNYSYEIYSGLSRDVWENPYLKFVHPAGLKLFKSLVLEIFNTNRWNEEIDYYGAEIPEGDYSWLNAYRAPNPGYHSPRFQPGWIDSGERILTFILSALKQKYVYVNGGSIIVTNQYSNDYGGYPIEVSAPRHGFNLNDRIKILNTTNDKIAGTHTIVELTRNSFKFVIPTTTTSVNADPNILIVVNNNAAPDGYRSYENLVCNILLELFCKNSVSRDETIHKTYQDWFKFVDSNELISGYLDKTIDNAIEPYKKFNEIEFNNISSYNKLINPKFSRFYPWNYSQIIRYEDDPGYFSYMQDSYSESYSYDVFENNIFNYNFSYITDYTPPEISFTSPIIYEDSEEILFETGDTILLENEANSSPNIIPPTESFEYILENDNTRIYEDEDDKILEQ
jgi:hypothetical protein